MNPSCSDESFMTEAIRLARGARGRTAPNPAVGAVVVRDGQIVGRGWTSPAGGPHAEIHALREAGDSARDATLYVTLEPCCHYGRTPPCTDAIVSAGIRRSVIAMGDPYPEVNGSGIAALRAAGVSVEVGTGSTEASETVAGFMRRIRTGRPLVHAKYAMTVDGRIATRTGHSRWVTGAAARQVVHELRDQVDAIAVGAGTVIADDPSLTTRLPANLAGWGGPHHPTRILVDGRGSVPITSRILDPSLPGTTIVATTASAPSAWRRAIGDRGHDCLVIGSGPTFPLTELLSALGDRGINHLLVEGGSRLLGGLFDENLVDRISAFVAPVLVGGTSAPGPSGGNGVATMRDALRLDRLRVGRLGDDVLIEGDIAAATDGRGDATCSAG
ncbi:MAG TPA: bifunctional diaminohydroxyphosphoribosylaminopyrimidine deaminase/5-amino-6-(5-phosphoribosylamino)uracil reductase RibD [Thermomicrobiales bacterium]|jgi:diaminohydroxyphosphoribosylaminopyrimidine deaminase/5-amino-6-(5-phosphoribosylamino)uracil reductase|nr:bifunctional diaminohydroxyphosphoribosylaminopyrimidine deaminase/5-amino-6-(5-phosphoribosylamino)uracil reductase RibD [Thermomicrobiales bacterium]